MTRAPGRFQPPPGAGRAPTDANTSLAKSRAIWQRGEAALGAGIGPDPQGCNLRVVGAHACDLSARPAPAADLREVDHGSAKAAMRARKVGDTPGETPQVVGSLANALPQFVDELNDERAAAEEQKPRAPIGVGAVEAQAETQAPRIERDGALGIGCADHEMIETRHGGGLGTAHRQRDWSHLIWLAGAKAQGHAAARLLIRHQAEGSFPGRGGLEG